MRARKCEGLHTTLDRFNQSGSSGLAFHPLAGATLSRTQHLNRTTCMNLITLHRWEPLPQCLVAEFHQRGQGWWPLLADGLEDAVQEAAGMAGLDAEFRDVPVLGSTNMETTTSQPSSGDLGRIQAATAFMLRLVLGGLCSFLCDAKAASTATLVGNCQSVILNSTPGTYNGNPGILYFSTFDGRTDIAPRRQPVGGSYLYGGELRKRSAGAYETDYSTINNSDGGYSYYGSVVVTLPTLDSDGLGIPDFAQRDKLGTANMTGTYYTRDWPTVVTVVITGTLTRSAGSTIGTYSIVDQATGGSVARISGAMEVQTYTGSFAYTRGAQNAATVTMTRTNAGASFNLSGNTPFTVPSANQLSLPQFLMTNSVDGALYTVLATTFARTGNKYVGSLRFADGDMRTSWADNTDWVFVITDLNDTDGNGIPDLSDSLPAAPTITTQPQNQTVSVGANVTFTVAASGTAPLAYQWQHAGTNLPGQTASTLTLNSVTAAGAGAYAVAVSNVGGTTTSATATLTVNSPAPVIASSATATATVGSAFSYTITANNSPTSYGATGLPAGLSVNPASGVISGTPTTDGSFTVNLSASNAGGTGTRTLTLTINATPAITTPPQSQTVAAGSSVTFSVVGAGTAPLSYQWRKDGTNLNGITGSSYTIPSVQASHAGSYTVVVSNVAGSVTSTPPAVLVVNGPASITTQPQSQTVAVGANVSFTVGATGSAPLSYQWRKSGSPITGATSATFALTSVQLTDAGVFDVVVTNAVGSATSGVVTLAVTTNSYTNLVLSVAGGGQYATIPSTPTIQPSNAITVELWFLPLPTAMANPVVLNKGDGQNVSSARSYEVDWKPSNGISFQLFLGTSTWAGFTVPAPVNQWVHFAATYDSVTSRINIFTNGSLAVSTTNDVGGSPLNGRKIRQTTLPLTLGLIPGLGDTYFNGSIDEVRIWNIARSGAEIFRDFHSRLAGTEPGLVGYWQFDGGTVTDLTTNANNGTLAAGAQIVAITGADIPHIGAPTIPQVSQNLAVAPGTNVTFTVAAASIAPLTYQWMKDGVLLAGQTNAQLNLSGLTNRARGGNFSVMVSNLYGAITGNIGSLRVRVPHRLQPPVATNGLFRLLSADQDGGLLTTNDLPFFSVQTSTNLTATNWLSFTYTNGLSLTNGMLRLDDTNAASRPFRYYRVSEQ